MNRIRFNQKPKFKLAGFFVAGQAGYLTLYAEPSQLLPDAFRLIDFSKPFTSVEGDWKGKAKVKSGQAEIQSCLYRGPSHRDTPSFERREALIS